MKRACIAAGFLALLFLPLPPARAESSFVIYGGSGKVVDQTLSPVRVQGRLEVEFHGDPAAGCAATGTCGTAGRVVWAPGGTAFLVLADYVAPEGRGTFGVLGLIGADDAVVAQVQRRKRGGTFATCSDVAQQVSGISFTAAGRGRVRLDLSGFGEGDLFETRCGGPLTADLRRQLPRPVFDVVALRRGRIIDLASERPFAAHGFAGTVRSSLALRLGRASRTGTGTGTPPPGYVTRRERTRTLTATYRVVRVGGQARIAFRGRPGIAACEPLDACGALGRIVVRPRATRGSFTFSASAPAAVPRARLRAALGLEAGPSGGVSVYAFGDWTGRGTSQATVARPDGPACRALGRAPSAYLTSRPRGAPLALTLAYEAIGAARTRCPGPASSEVGTLLSARVSRAQLGRRRTVLHLRRGHAFAGEAHAGATSGDVTVVLRRVSLREQTEVESTLSPPRATRVRAWPRNP